MNPHVRKLLATEDVIHQASLITAFATGVLMADQFYWGYSPPHNFAAVLGRLAKSVELRFGRDVVVNVSLGEIEDFYLRFFQSDADAASWYAPMPGTNGRFEAITAFDKIQNERTSSIDMHAAIRNASMFILKSVFNRDASLVVMVAPS